MEVFFLISPAEKPMPEDTEDILRCGFRRLEQIIDAPHCVFTLVFQLSAVAHTEIKICINMRHVLLPRSLTAFSRNRNQYFNTRRKWYASILAFQIR